VLRIEMHKPQKRGVGPVKDRRHVTPITRLTLVPIRDDSLGLSAQ
jgi:hypothetical protein